MTNSVVKQFDLTSIIIWKACWEAETKKEKEKYKERAVMETNLLDLRVYLILIQTVKHFYNFKAIRAAQYIENLPSLQY